MNTLQKILRIILIILTAFLAICAILGGIVLMGNIYAPPVEMLAGSVFPSFFLPGLALTLIVGGSALAAMILLIRRHKFGVLIALTSGVIIMFFEFIEVLVIGMTPGPTAFMQVLFFMIGTAICVFAAGLWGIDLMKSDNS